MNTKAKGASTRRETRARPKILRDHIVGRICRLADAMVRMSAEHMQQRWGLRNTDLRLLNVLGDEGPLSVNELSRRALLDQAWVSRSLRALERDKLVTRRNHHRDSRVSLISLTPHGRGIVDQFRPYAAWSERVLLTGVDEEKLKALLDQLETNTKGLIDIVDSLPKTWKRGS